MLARGIPCVRQRRRLCRTEQWKQTKKIRGSRPGEAFNVRPSSVDGKLIAPNVAWHDARTGSHYTIISKRDGDGFLEREPNVGFA